MSRIAIISDSTASLRDDVVQRYGIYVVPLYIHIGDQTLRDGVDITPERFYERLPHTTPLPTTSQPSVGDFTAVYRRAVQDGADAIISIHLSSGISGTVNSAQLAAQEVEGARIEIVDTANAAAAHQLAVEAAAQAVADGADLEETLRTVRAVLHRNRTIFTVDTLEYLYKGGRIGGAAALLGSVLQFRPLLYFKDGRIDALERVRRSGRALARMVEIMEGWLEPEVPVKAVLMHAAAMDRVRELEGLIQGRLPVAQAEVVPLTPVIGTHVGNGTVGMCCCPMELLGGDGQSGG